MWLVSHSWGMTTGCRSRRGQTELVAFAVIQYKSQLMVALLCAVLA